MFASIDCTEIQSSNDGVIYEYNCNFVCGGKDSNENNNIFTLGKEATDWVGIYEKSCIREISLENCSFDDESTWQGGWNLQKLTVSSL